MWELTAAYITAKRDPIGFRRLCLLNTGVSTKNLPFLPPELRDGSYAYTPETAAQALNGKLKGIDGVFGDLTEIGHTQPYDMTITSSERFTGRTETFWEIHNKLNSSDFNMITAGAKHGVALLTGFGGTGKTLLAQEYALRFSMAYPGGVFWLKAHGSYNPDFHDIEMFRALRMDEFKKAARQLGLSFDERINIHGLRQLIAEKLGANGKPVLWVVDDLPSGLVVRGFAEDALLWLAPHRNARTLMTARSLEYKDFGGNIALDQLEQGEALELLRSNGVDVGGQLDAAIALVKRLGCNALAVDIAGSELKGFGDPIKAYLEKIDQHSTIINETPLIKKALPGGHAANIVATLDTSLTKLQGEELDFLRLAAHLSPAPIKLNLWALVLVIVDELEMEAATAKARQTISGCDLLSLTKGTGTSRTVHPLISDVIRFKGYADDERALSIRRAAFTALYQILDHTTDHAYVQNISDELEHARHLTREIKEKGPEYNLLKRLAEFDHFRGNVALAVEDSRRIVEIDARISGPDHLDTLTSMHNYASTLWAMGDRKGAKVLEEEVLEKRKAILGPDHPDTLQSMNNLASILGALGDYEGAKYLLVTTLEKLKTIFGPDHPDTIQSMNNLSLTLGALGNHDGARVLQEEVLERFKTILGPDHPDTLTSLNNLASTLRAMGDLEGAKVILVETLERFKKVLGPDHPGTLTAMNNLASTLGAMEEYEGAFKLRDEVVEKSKRVLGPDHPDTITYISNLVTTHNILGEDGQLSKPETYSEDKNQPLPNLDRIDESKPSFTTAAETVSEKSQAFKDIVQIRFSSTLSG